MTNETASKTRRFHVQATIPYVIARIQEAEREGRSQDYVTSHGQPVSFPEAILELRQMQQDGLRLVPCCANVNDAGECQGAIVIARATGGAS